MISLLLFVFSAVSGAAPCPKKYNGKQRVEVITELLGMGGKYPDVAFEPLVFESAEIQNDNPFVREIIAEGIDLLPVPKIP